MYLIDKNKVTADEQLKRMKSLMSYGINESKQPSYSSVEYGKVAADGKLYGIIREGAKYFIKVAKDVNGGLISENFDYIGGFRNRKDNQFDSFASAQRYFGEKLMDINENVGSDQKKVIAEAWDLDAKKEVVEEQTKKIQSEIARQKQIMKNAVRISEGKKQECDMPCCPNAKEEKAEKIDWKNPSAPFVNVTFEEGRSNEKDNIKGKKKAVKESSEVELSSRECPECMDKSKGTKIGKNAPFNIAVKKEKDAVADEDGGDSVNEEKMSSDDQDTPVVGTGMKGKTAPFDKNANVNESLDDLDDDIDDDVDDVDIDADGDVEDIDVDTDDDGDEDVEITIDGEDVPSEAKEYEIETDNEDDVNTRIDDLESKMDAILDAINSLKYNDDDELYPDDKESDGEDVEDDDNTDADDYEEDEHADGDEADYADDDEADYADDDDEDVVESISYKRMKARAMNEGNRLNDFGKHPSYQKKVMTTPSDRMAKKGGQYDMNDGSVDGDKAYGKKKGTQAPFGKKVKSIEDAITESVIRKLKKKIGLTRGTF